MKAAHVLPNTNGEREKICLEEKRVNFVHVGLVCGYYIFLWIAKDYETHRQLESAHSFSLLF